MGVARAGEDHLADIRDGVAFTVAARPCSGIGRVHRQTVAGLELRADDVYKAAFDQHLVSVRRLHIEIRSIGTIIFQANNVPSIDRTVRYIDIPPDVDRRIFDTNSHITVVNGIIIPIRAVTLNGHFFAVYAIDPNDCAALCGNSLASSLNQHGVISRCKLNISCLCHDSHCSCRRPVRNNGIILQLDRRGCSLSIQTNAVIPACLYRAATLRRATAEVRYCATVDIDTVSCAAETVRSGKVQRTHDLSRRAALCGARDSVSGQVEYAVGSDTQAVCGAGDRLI